MNLRPASVVDLAILRIAHLSLLEGGVQNGGGDARAARADDWLVRIDIVRLEHLAQLMLRQKSLGRGVQQVRVRHVDRARHVPG